MNRSANFLLGALIGGFIGAAIAILVAPTSGENLRNEIRMRSDQVRADVSQAAADRRAELESQLASLRAPRKQDQEM